jgi:hypothetical protein
MPGPGTSEINERLELCFTSEASMLNRSLATRRRVELSVFPA